MNPIRPIPPIDYERVTATDCSIYLAKCAVMLRVNAFSGEVCLTAGGFVLPGPIPIDLTPSYSSGSKHSDLFGRGWSTALDIAMTEEGPTAVLWIAGQEVFRFKKDNAGKDGPYSLRSETNDGYHVSSASDKRTYDFVRARSGRIRLKAIRDALGNHVDFDRNDAGQIVSLTDSRRRQLEFKYAGDLLTRVDLKRWGREAMNLTLLRCEYDLSGGLINCVNAQGTGDTFHYDSGMLVGYANPLGGTQRAQYDSTGRCHRKWELDGLENMEFHYDTRLHVTRVVDSKGYTWLYRFNESGTLLTVTDPLGGCTRNVVDSAGNILGTFDPTGEIQAGYLVENAGRHYTEIGPGNVHTKMEFNEKGEITAIIDACDNRWERIPDGRGSYRQVKSPLGYVWKVDQAATESKVIEPSGETTVYQTLDDGRRMVVTDTLGKPQEYHFDVLGRITRVRHGSGFDMEVMHTERGERVEFADGSTQESSLNALGQVVEFTNENRSRWHYKYDRFGRLLEAMDPLGGTIAYMYNALGHPLSLTNELGETFKNEYNPIGFITRQVSFDGGNRDFAYDAAGRPIARTEPTGLHIEITSDAQGVPITYEFPDDKMWSAERDPGGRLIRSAGSKHELIREYDPHRRISVESYGAHEVRFEYGWRLTPIRIQAAGRDIHFTYDSEGQVDSIREDDFAIRVERDSKRETTVIQSAARLSVVNVFDASGNLIDKQVLSGATESLVRYQFAYDRAGSLIERRRSPGAAWNYRYGNRGELQEIERNGNLFDKFRYDLAHNRQSSLAGEYKIERGNRLVHSPFGTYAYDAAGRRTRHETNDGRVVTYEFDGFGRLSQSRSSDGTLIDFDYDWLWRRRSKTTNGKTRAWIWAGDVPLVDLGPDGDRIDYLFHPDEFLPIGLRIDGAWHYIVTDYRGEPLDVVRIHDGAIVWSAEPRGFDSQVTLDQLGGRFGLRAPGQYVDSESSLLYNRARYYDPNEGRFLTPDPLGPTTGANLYHFCFNQPLSYTDGTGLAPCATKVECDAIFADIKETVESRKPPAAMKGMEQRWKETADASQPADILAWEIPPSGINPPKGTVRGHITAYKSTQNRLTNQINKYDKKGCQAHEDQARKDSMDYHRAWQTEKMKLGPGYGTPPPHIAALL